jgi:hypothetical protein
MEMNDQRVEQWSLLHQKDLPDSLFIEDVPGQTVDRLGRDGYQISFSKDLRCFGYVAGNDTHLNKMPGEAEGLTVVNLNTHRAMPKLTFNS